MSLSFPVSPEKNQALRARLQKLSVQESDFVETFTKASGKGGQNRNKVSTAVFLTHVPTGLFVKCGVYRTQGLNRYKARQILLDKIENLLHGNRLVNQEIYILRKKKEDKKRKRKKTRENEREIWDTEE